MSAEDHAEAAPGPETAQNIAPEVISDTAPETDPELEPETAAEESEESLEEALGLDPETPLGAALLALQAEGSKEAAAAAAAYHRTDRIYLGVPVPRLDEIARDWRRDMSLEERLELAQMLWESDIHDARIMATKLLTQARIRPDDAAVWQLICGWLPDLDGWAIADHLAAAAQRRITADPARLDEVEAWTTSANLWTRRSALVATLVYARKNNPGDDTEAARDRVLGWAAGYLEDREKFIQKAVAQWLRDLSKHDAARTRAFLAENGSRMPAFARNEASKFLGQH